MQIFDNDFIEVMLKQAICSERLRINYLLHKTPEEKCQRMINVLIPGTKIPIQVHNIDETLILIRGEIIVKLYTSELSIKNILKISQYDNSFGIIIPAGQIHDVEVLEPSVIFEVKEGPFHPSNTRTFNL